MPNRSKKPGTTVDIDCLYDIAKVVVLAPKRCDFSTSEKMIHVDKLEDFLIQFFSTEITIVVDGISLLSTEDLVSL